MGEAERGPGSWRPAVRTALRDLSLTDMPAFEVLFLDELAEWAFSVANPGHGYDEKHAGTVIGALLRALRHARSFRPGEIPSASREVTGARGAVVTGAHEFAAADDGLPRLIGLLVPAVVRELDQNAGKPAAQTYWLYHYCLLALASGMDATAGEATLRGITAAFHAWNELLAAGLALPWRTRLSMRAQASADMVTSHVETLIERLTGVEKALPDADGDYPIRYRSALYYVRVVRAWTPVVQVFSVAVDGIELSDALARELNEINAGLHFARAFWVRGQVLFEAEHLGPSLTEADFHECALNVAQSTDEHAPRLAGSYGGRLAFEEAKTPEYTSPAAERVGPYL